MLFSATVFIHDTTVIVHLYTCDFNANEKENLKKTDLKNLDYSSPLPKKGKFECCDCIRFHFPKTDQKTP